MCKSSSSCGCMMKTLYHTSMMTANKVCFIFHLTSHDSNPTEINNPGMFPTELHHTKTGLKILVIVVWNKEGRIMVLGWYFPYRMKGYLLFIGHYELLWCIMNPYGKILKNAKRSKRLKDFVNNHEKSWLIIICTITFQRGIIGFWMACHLESPVTTFSFLLSN